MKKIILTVLGLACVAAICRAADDTFSFTYQARLCDDKGNPLTRASGAQPNQQVTLRLWNQSADGVLQWGRTYDVLLDNEGLFSLAVSDLSGSAVSEATACSSLADVFKRNAAGGVYIGVQVRGSAGEIVPRQRIFAVPFASVANDVRGISSDVTVKGKMDFGGGVSVSSSGLSQAQGTASLSNVRIGGMLDVMGQTRANGGLAVKGGTATFDNNVQLPANKYVQYNGADVIPVPVGGIIMWTQSNMPNNDTVHWHMCDGQAGTPDLRNRFIVAAGDKYGYGAKGGADSVTLSESQMPKHRHYYVGDDQLEGIDKERDCSTSVYRTYHGYDANSSLSGDSRVYQTNEKGGNAAHENRPPYYALYYIMRIK